MAPRTRLVRPRLLAGSLIVALVVGVVGGWATHRLTSDRADVVAMNEPGEYQEPLDADLAEQDGPTASGAALPDVTLTDADGTEVTTASLVGEPLVINVWFSTCPPCVRELADFAEVHAEVGDRVRFVGVNPLDRPDRMLEFASDRGVAYELLRDEDMLFTDAVSLTSFPRTYLVDAAGTIVVDTGELHADELRTLIEEHLVGEPL